MAENDLGFNPATDPAESIPDEQLNLKKRARRRLVGAIALALLAVIVLPMVMDQEPKPLTQDIQIRIPSPESSSVSALSRVTPSKPAATSAAVPTPVPATASSIPAATTEAQPGNRSAAKAETKPETKPETKTESLKAGVTGVPIVPSKPSEAKVAEKPVEKPVEKPAAKAPSQELEAARATELLNAEQWVVQLGAYQDMANIKALQGKIKGLGLPSFTEKVDTPQGPRTRVRSGPFDSREAAEKAHERLKKIGVGAPLGGVVAKK